MWCLVSCCRNEMELSISYFEKYEDALNCMNEQIKSCTETDVSDYVCNEEDGEYIDGYGACLQLNHLGTTVWVIDEVC